VVIRLPAVPTVDTLGPVGRALGGAGREPGRSRHLADDRLHHRPGAPARSRRKRGTRCNALGRSRGGLSTKIHIRANAEGLGFGFVLTGGEAHDSTGYVPLMAESGPDPKVLLGDRAYDADPIRADVEARGGTPVIPTKRNRKIQIATDELIYALRNRIERGINRLKNSRRVATRYDKTATSFLAFVQLAAVRLWLRHFVNRT
jgi:transposase